MPNQPDFYNPIQYSIAKQPFFRFTFPGLSDIQINYSQLHQDMFVLCALNGKRDGTYLEIGAHEPIFISNTFLLEQSLGWRGLGLELDEALVAKHRRLRRNLCLHADALTVNYGQCLENAAMPSVIDYLSLDIDPPANSLKALMRLPLQQVRFRVITFEHDLSFGGSSERVRSRQLLQELGYQLVVADVSWGEHVVEDWWVDPDLTNPEIIKQLCPANPNRHHQHDVYFYNPVAYSSASRTTVAGKLDDSTADKVLDICVEGWRNLNHSFSLVNQWQLLELLKRPARLAHRDIEPLNPQWNAQKNASGLPEDLAEQIQQIPVADGNNNYSVVYRITFPMNLHEATAERLVVFGTAGDCNGIPYVGCTPTEACSRGDLTIVTPSEWSKSAFLRLGFSSDSIVVIPHGVAPNCFFQVEPSLRLLYRQIFGFDQDDFVLLHLGGLSMNKGVDVLLRAYARLKPDYPQLKLFIKDQSSLYARNLQCVVREMTESGKPLQLSEEHWNDVIILSENLDLDAMRSLYNACDLYVSPYRAEGFNLPPLEAAACGLPILVTAGGATNDYFSPQLGLQIASQRFEQDWGSVLEPDLEALQEAIIKVVDCPRGWGGATGSQWVHRHYSWEKIGDRLWQVLAPD